MAVLALALRRPAGSATSLLPLCASALLCFVRVAAETWGPAESSSKMWTIKHMRHVKKSIGFCHRHQNDLTGQTDLANLCGTDRPTLCPISSLPPACRHMAGGSCSVTDTSTNTELHFTDAYSHNDAGLRTRSDVSVGESTRFSSHSLEQAMWNDKSCSILDAMCW